jgi:hypothetical protein
MVVLSICRLIGGGRACDGSGGSLSFSRTLCWWKNIKRKGGKVRMQDATLLRRLSNLLMEWAPSPDHLRSHIFNTNFYAEFYVWYGLSSYHLNWKDSCILRTKKMRQDKTSDFTFLKRQDKTSDFTFLKRQDETETSQHGQNKSRLWKPACLFSNSGRRIWTLKHSTIWLGFDRTLTIY